MAKKTVPAWQQVLLVALESVPEHDNGADAWQRLNPAEQAAIMDYLAAHCGDEAQAKLDETTAMIGSGKRYAWLWVLLVMLVITALLIWGYWVLEQRVGDLKGWVIILLCLSRLEQAWNVSPVQRMAEIWGERTSTHAGTASALKEMHQTFFLPKKEFRSKAVLALWAALLMICVIVTVVEI